MLQKTNHLYKEILLPEYQCEAVENSSDEDDPDPLSTQNTVDSCTEFTTKQVLQAGVNATNCADVTNDVRDMIERYNKNACEGMGIPKNKNTSINDFLNNSFRENNPDE